jgi:hypothetical protein
VVVNSYFPIHHHLHRSLQDLELFLSLLYLRQMALQFRLEELVRTPHHRLKDCKLSLI